MEGRVEDAGGQLHRCSRVCAQGRACRGRSQSQDTEREDRQTALRRTDPQTWLGGTGRSKRGTTRHPPAAAPTSSRRLPSAPPLPRACAASPPPSRAALRRTRPETGARPRQTWARARAVRKLCDLVHSPSRPGLPPTAHHLSFSLQLLE